jgi:MPBQ/MSBQ methyltransferase
MSNRDRDAASAAPNGGAATERVTERLSSIVRALDGRHVDTNGEELWFDATAGDGLQVRLGGDADARCYDRSANFAISYRGRTADAPVSPHFAALVEQIKAIDAAPLADVRTAFRAAATAVARRFGARNEPAAATAADPAPPSTANALEHDRNRQLNVIFLDLCRQLAGRPDPLFPLHWGFWPTDAAIPPAAAPVYDPQQAFSEELLAHIPAGVSRVLDVGCGLGFNERLLSARGFLVTAVSPVAHHCQVIAAATLPGVEVRCARFEDLAPDEPYDLLLFSESVNHFPLDDHFLRHCRAFLRDAGFVLMADDLTDERARAIETQRVFRLLHSVDITRNVAPTADWWARQMHGAAAFHGALMSILALYDPPLATRVREVLEAVDSSELRLLFSGHRAPPVPKGRYMIYLLQLDRSADSGTPADRPG